MQYYVNGEKLKNNLYKNYIGKGIESKAYKIDDKVIKIFRMFPGKKVVMTKESIEKMKQIPTKRILLPTNSLLDKKNKIRGYQMNYVASYGIDSYFNLDKDKLIKEHQLLKDDIKILSESGILINDLIIENTVYSNGLYLIDPGSYMFHDNIGFNYAYRSNLDCFDRYLIYEILFNYHFNNYNNSKHFASSLSFSNEINLEYNKSKKEGILEFFSDIEEDTLGQFVKRKVR